MIFILFQFKPKKIKTILVTQQFYVKQSSIQLITVKFH